MTIETVNIEEYSLSVALLELKDGKQLKTEDGRYISVAFLGVINIDSAEQPTDYTEHWALGVWESVEKYKAALKLEPYSAPVAQFNLTFNASPVTVPIAVLNQLNFNNNWLFHREITSAFLNIILQLPDPTTGAPFGDRWQIY